VFDSTCDSACDDDSVNALNGVNASNSSCDCALGNSVSENGCIDTIDDCVSALDGICVSALDGICGLSSRVSEYDNETVSVFDIG
jgi:hypothetical protein